jgi:hypothetical protein
MKDFGIIHPQKAQVASFQVRSLNSWLVRRVRHEGVTSRDSGTKSVESECTSQELAGCRLPLSAYHQPLHLIGSSHLVTQQ